MPSHHATTWPGEWRVGRKLADLRPSLLDPIVSRRWIVMSVAGLGPVRRRRDVANRNSDHPCRVEDLERIGIHVLAEPGDGVVIALVVIGADVEIPARGLKIHTFQLADDHLF